MKKLLYERLENGWIKKFISTRKEFIMMDDSEYAKDSTFHDDISFMVGLHPDRDRCTLMNAVCDHEVVFNDFNEDYHPKDKMVLYVYNIEIVKSNITDRYLMRLHLTANKLMMNFLTEGMKMKTDDIICKISFDDSLHFTDYDNECYLWIEPEYAIRHMEPNNYKNDVLEAGTYDLCFSFFSNNHQEQLKSLYEYCQQKFHDKCPITFETNIEFRQ